MAYVGMNHIYLGTPHQCGCGGPSPYGPTPPTGHVARSDAVRSWNALSHAQRDDAAPTSVRRLPRSAALTAASQLSGWSRPSTDRTSSGSGHRSNG